MTVSEVLRFDRTKHPSKIRVFVRQHGYDMTSEVSRAELEYAAWSHEANPAARPNTIINGLWLTEDDILSLLADAWGEDAGKCTVCHNRRTIADRCGDCFQLDQRREQP